MFIYIYYFIVVSVVSMAWTSLGWNSFGCLGWHTKIFQNFFVFDFIYKLWLGWRKLVSHVEVSIKYKIVQNTQQTNELLSEIPSITTQTSIFLKLCQQQQQSQSAGFSRFILKCCCWIEDSTVLIFYLATCCQDDKHAVNI